MAAARHRLVPALVVSALCHGGIVAALAAYTLPSPPPAPSYHNVTLAFVHPPLATAAPPPQPSQPSPAKTDAKPVVRPAAKPRPLATQVPTPQPQPQNEAATGPAEAERISPSAPVVAASLPTAETAPAPLPVILHPDYLSPPEPPLYPPAARRLQIEGTVVIRALVERPGHPSQVTLWRSSGESLLDRSALEAVRYWRFRPMTHSGGMVAAWVEVPITFSISNT